MIKVCYVAHAANLTGANQSLLDMLDGLPDEVKPFVLLPKQGPLVNELKKRHIPYKIIFYAKAIKTPIYIKTIIKKWVLYFEKIRIKSFLQHQDFDIVHNNSFLITTPALAAQELQIPIICHVRDFGKEDHNIEYINEKIQTHLLNSSFVIFISKSVYRKFSKYLLRKNYEILYDGIDVNRYLNSDKEIFNNSNINCLLSGRITKGKGQLEAVKAVERVFKDGYVNVRLTLIGACGEGKKDREYFENIKDYIKLHNLDNLVKIHSFTSNLNKWRNNSDIGLTCSSHEALGRVTVETMLSGCLAIGSNSDGTSEIITSKENGLLYQVGDYRDLAAKIEYVIKNPLEMKKVAVNGRAWARLNFDNKKYGRIILNLYKKILYS